MQERVQKRRKEGLGVEAGSPVRPENTPHKRTVRTVCTEQGDAAEALAGAYLRAQGLRLLAHQVRFKGGEIDWVAEDGQTVVFVEVRLRRNKGFGSAADSLDARKQARLIRAAQLWLLKAGTHWQNRPCRFDAVLLDRLSMDAIEWIQGAFDAQGHG